MTARDFLLHASGVRFGLHWCLEDRVAQAGSVLTMVVVAGGFILGSILVIVLLLVLAGFLTIPALVLIAVGSACLALLGFSIAAALLSRGTRPNSR
jgi:hypothetical protein